VNPSYFSKFAWKDDHLGWTSSNSNCNCGVDSFSPCIFILTYKTANQMTNIRKLIYWSFCKFYNEILASHYPNPSKTANHKDLRKSEQQRRKPLSHQHNPRILYNQILSKSTYANCQATTTTQSFFKCSTEPEIGMHTTSFSANKSTHSCMFSDF
jgi:hypothetical protein